jgi:hypothetical protein
MTRINVWTLSALVAVAWTAAAARGQDVDNPAAQPQDGRSGPGLWRETDWCDIDAPTAGPRGDYATNTWPGGIVPYQFNINVTPQNQQRAIDAMAEIEAVCNVDFIPWTTGSAYLFINAVASGNNSCVGYSGGVCTVNISEWESKGIIMHEFGHSLGLWHEQQRPDRNSYVQVISANICSGAGNFTVTGTPFGPYDFESVMHYPRRSNSRNGSETISVLPAYAEWKYYCGQNHHLSNGDIWVLTHLYGGARPPKTFRPHFSRAPRTGRRGVDPVVPVGDGGARRFVSPPG